MNQDQITWIPFSLIDVHKLEQGYSQSNIFSHYSLSKTPDSNSEQEIISTNGNRYDVNLIQRTHTPVYWIDKPNEVRRSKWYYSTSKDPRLIPVDESTDDILEVTLVHFIHLQSNSISHRNFSLKLVKNILGIKNMKSFPAMNSSYFILLIK